MALTKNQIRLIAGFTALLMGILAWVAWPEGDLPRATRLLEGGQYQEALAILDRLNREGNRSLEMQFLRAEALIGLEMDREADLVLFRLPDDGQGRLLRLKRLSLDCKARQALALLEQGQANEAFERLEKLTEGEIHDSLREIILQAIEHQAQRELWSFAAWGWMLVSKDGWRPPPQEFQRHMAMFCLINPYLMVDSYTREMMTSYLDADFSLSRMALTALKLHDLDTASPSQVRVLQAEVEELALQDWAPYGPIVQKIAHDLPREVDARAHLRLLALGEVKPGQGLSPEALDYALEYSWRILGGNGFGSDSRARFLKGYSRYPTRFQPMAQLLAAALKGELPVASEGTKFLAGQDFRYSWQLLGQKPVGNFYKMSWSSDGQFLSVQSAGRVEIFSAQGQVAELGGASFLWAPSGSTFLLDGKYYASPDAQPRELPQTVRGWWFDNETLFDAEGNLYDLQGRTKGQREIILAENYSFSQAGLLLTWGWNHSNEGISLSLYNKAEERLYSLGVSPASLQTQWAPSGTKALVTMRRPFGLANWDHSDSNTYLVLNEHFVLSPQGVQWLRLPPGSSVLGWLDEDRLLAGCVLGFQEGWYIYTLASQEIEYIQPLEGFVAYPAGDGRSFAWIKDSQVCWGTIHPLH